MKNDICHCSHKITDHDGRGCLEVGCACVSVYDTEKDLTPYNPPKFQCPKCLQKFSEFTDAERCYRSHKRI